MEKNKSWIIRNGDERDLKEILSLRRVVFGEMEKDKLNPEFWRWEFMGGPDGKAFIYIAEEKGSLIGHFADIPRRFSVNGKVVLGTLSLDLMVRPDFRRRGIFEEMGTYAVQHVKAERGLFLTAYPIRKETIRGLIKIGWKKIVELPVLVYPIRFQGIVNRYLHIRPLSFLLGGVIGVFHLLLFQGRARAKAVGGIDVDQVDQLGEEFDLFWQRASSISSIIGVRDQCFLNWRYRKNPSRTYTIYRTKKNGEMTGYIVLRKVDLLQFNSAVIVDLLVLDKQSLNALVAKGIEHSYKEGAVLLGFMVPKTHPYYGSLIARGFLPSLKSFQFMIYDCGNVAALEDPKGWYVNWGDSDVI